MKRSEMINYIKHYLHGDSNYPKHRDEADVLLMLIEALGMQPPIKDSKFCELHCNCSEEIVDSSWEKEHG